MKPIVFNLPNEEYHRSEATASYISSTQLKDYAVSPAYAKAMRENPSERKITPSMKVGTMLHEYMEHVINGDPLDAYAVFEAPTNAKTGQPYGESTLKYQEAYQEFLSTADGKTIITKEQLALVASMASAILSKPENKRLIEYAKPKKDALKGAEISFFCDLGEGILAKCRTDALTSKKIVDWKTTSGGLTPEDVARTVVNFKYDVSAAFYQYILWKVTGQYYGFYWIFVKNDYPVDATVPMSAENFAFRSEDDLIMFDDDKDGSLVFNHGVMEMRALLNEHVWCMQNNSWPGPEVFVEPTDSGDRILAPECPAYAATQVTKFFH